MAMKEYSVFPKAPALLDLTIRLFSVISRIHVAGGGSTGAVEYKSAVSVFYSPSRLESVRSGTVMLTEVQSVFCSVFLLAGLAF